VKSPGSSPRAADALRGLRRGLEGARGFSLFIAVCNSPAEQRAYVARLGEAMLGVAPRVFETPPGTVDLLQSVVERFGTEPGGPLHVLGLEAILSEAADPNAFTFTLNLGRGLWRERCPAPVVFWLTEFGEGLLSRLAPDFMDWRSDTIEFPSEAPDLLPIRSEVWRAGDDGRFSAEERRRRVEELESRVAAYESSEDPGTRSVLSDWLTELGRHYLMLGEPEPSEAAFRKKIDIEESLGRPYGMAVGYGDVGGLGLFRGDLVQAEAMYQKSLALSEQAGDRGGIAVALGNLGVIFHQRGDLPAAEAAFRQSLKINEELGHSQGMAANYSSLGTIFLDRGDLDQAEAMYRQSLEINERLGRLRASAADYASRGNVAFVRGDRTQAEAWYRKSMEINERLGDRAGLADNIANLGGICLDRGDLTRAQNLYQISLELNERLGRLEALARNHEALGLICVQRADAANALERFRSAREHYRRLGAGPAVARLQGRIAEIERGAEVALAPRGRTGDASEEGRGA